MAMLIVLSQSPLSGVNYRTARILFEARAAEHWQYCMYKHWYPDGKVYLGWPDPSINAMSNGSQTTDTIWTGSNP